MWSLRRSRAAGTHSSRRPAPRGPVTWTIRPSLSTWPPHLRFPQEELWGQQTRGGSEDEDKKMEAWDGRASQAKKGGAWVGPSSPPPPAVPGGRHPQAPVKAPPQAWLWGGTPSLSSSSSPGSRPVITGTRPLWVRPLLFSAGHVACDPLCPGPPGRWAACSVGSLREMDTRHVCQCVILGTQREMHTMLSV